MASIIVLAISLALVFVCSIVQCVIGRRPASKAIAGRGIFLASLISSIILFVVAIIQLALVEDRARVKYSYYTVYAILDFFSWLTPLLILLTLARIARLNRAMYTIIALLLSLILVAAFTMAIILAVYNINPVSGYSATARLPRYDTTAIVLEALNLVFDVIVLFALIAILAVLANRRSEESYARRGLGAIALLAGLIFGIQLMFSIAADAIFLKAAVNPSYYLTMAAYSNWLNSSVYRFTQVAPDIEHLLLALTLLSILVAYSRTRDTVAAGYPQQYSADQYGTGAYPQSRPGFFSRHFGRGRPAASPVNGQQYV